MKILVVSQVYAPEPFVIDKICEGLVERGHEVTVVTSVPNYSKGKVYEGYEKGQRRDEEVKGVKIHRCKVVPRKKGIVNRLLNYYSFVASSKRYLKKCRERYDVVFCYQLSPVMQGTAAVEYAKRTNIPFVLYCLDLWPESLMVGNMSKKSWAYKYYAKVSKNIYSAADKLLVSSYPFIARMSENFGFNPEDISYLPQHAEEGFSPESCVKQEDEYCDLLFAGNIGMAQSVETIIRAAKELREKENLRFHIVGAGTSLEEAKLLAMRLGTTNVFFYGKHPLEEMPEFYQKADAMLITYAKMETLSLTVPLKTQSYMAAGKPILCAADGAAAEEIKKANCGYVSNAEDVEGLKTAVLRFLDTTIEERKKMGVNARAYFEQNFTKEKFLDGLEKALEEAIKKD